MTTVGPLAGGYGVDRKTASHLLGADTPMMHQCLSCALLEEQAVKTKIKMFFILSRILNY